MNAKIEFLETVNDMPVFCAVLSFGDDPIYHGIMPDMCLLKRGYSQSDYIRFLKEIDRDYDDGFGGQNLYGIIWMDGIWAERDEYDGSESWAVKKYPVIPKELQS